MKLSLNVGDWATLAFFALGVLLGCFAQAEPRAKAPAPSATTASQSSSTRTALAAVGLE